MIDARAFVELAVDREEQIVERASSTLVQQPEVAALLDDAEELRDWESAVSLTSETFLLIGNLWVLDWS